MLVDANVGKNKMISEQKITAETAIKLYEFSLVWPQWV